MKNCCKTHKAKVHKYIEMVASLRPNQKLDVRLKCKEVDMVLAKIAKCECQDQKPELFKDSAPSASDRPAIVCYKCGKYYTYEIENLIDMFL